MSPTRGRAQWPSTLTFLAHIGGGGALPVLYDPVERIILRKRDKTPLDYSDTDRTRAMRKRCAMINEMLSSAQVSHPDLGVVRAR